MFLLITLDILSEYNPELVGGSYNRPGISGNGSSCSGAMECSQLNVAVPGATNRCAMLDIFTFYFC